MAKPATPPDVFEEAPSDFTKSAEFEAAVSKATTDAVAKLMPEIVGKMLAAQPGAAQPSGMNEFAEALAMAIAKLTDQNSQFKHVDPAVIAKREAAKERMIGLIVEARASQDKARKPWYRLVHKTQLENQVIDPFYRDNITKKMMPQEIGWDGIPNTAMRPINASAEAIFAEMLIWTDTLLPNSEPGLFGGVTASGLIIGHKNPGGVEPIIADSQRPDGSSPSTGGLIIGHRGRGDPGPQIHTLGTLHPPMRQVG